MEVIIWGGRGILVGYHDINLWRNISEGYDGFFREISFKIGRGNSDHVYKDVLWFKYSRSEFTLYFFNSFEKRGVLFKTLQ